MKAIIDYFRKRQDKRLRTKIALRTGHTVNDLQAVYEFIMNGAPIITRSGYSFTDLSSKVTAGGRMPFIDESFRDNIQSS